MAAASAGGAVPDVGGPTARTVVPGLARCVAARRRTAATSTRLAHPRPVRNARCRAGPTNAVATRCSGARRQSTCTCRVPTPEPRPLAVRLSCAEPSGSAPRSMSDRQVGTSYFSNSQAAPWSQGAGPPGCSSARPGQPRLGRAGTASATFVTLLGSSASRADVAESSRQRGPGPAALGTPPSPARSFVGQRGAWSAPGTRAGTGGPVPRPRANAVLPSGSVAQRGAVRDKLKHRRSWPPRPEPSRGKLARRRARLTGSTCSNDAPRPAVRLALSTRLGHGHAQALASGRPQPGKAVQHAQQALPGHQVRAEAEHVVL
eukprot:g38586.t1